MEPFLPPQIDSDRCCHCIIPLEENMFFKQLAVVSLAAAVLSAGAGVTFAQTMTPESSVGASGSADGTKAKASVSASGETTGSGKIKAKGKARASANVEHNRPKPTFTGVPNPDDKPTFRCLAPAGVC